MDECLFIIGRLPLTIKGRENFKKGETYIVLCNHNALIDVPVSFPEFPAVIKNCKNEMARYPYSVYI